MVNWKKWFLEEDEDEVFEGNAAKKEKKDELAERREKRAENRKRERVYYEDEEDFEIDFSSNKNRKSFDDELSPEFSENYEKTTQKLDDYEEVDLDDFEIDDYEDEDFEEEFQKNKKSKKENGFMSKIKGLFTSNKQDEEFLDEEDDEAEDYKTYLERQKREQEERAKHEEKEKSRVVKERYKDESDYEDDSDYVQDYEEEGSKKKVGFFSRLKDKLFNVSDDEIDQEELDAVLDDFEEELENEKDVTKKKFEIIDKKLSKQSDDELEIEFVEEQKATPKYEEIDITEYEEKEEVVSTGKVTDLGDALKKLGVSGTEIRDVDIFDENPSRRAHPTLAAVRTKRLKQDHKIDALGDSVVLGKDSSELKEEVASSFKGQVQEDEVVQDERVTKNKDALKEFEENFNTL